MTRPSITVAGLQAALGRAAVIEQRELDSLLGPNRHAPSLNQLQLALERSGVLSRTQLLELIRAASGSDVLDSTVRPTELLPHPVSRSTGAVVIAEEPLTVAMVEDLPDHLSVIAAHLGTAEFDVVLVTALQYDDLRTSAYVTGQADERGELASLYEALDEATASGASDLHLKVGVPPTVRVDGATRQLPYRPLDTLWLRSQIGDLAGEDALAQLDRDFDVDFAYNYGPHRFRFNLGMDRKGPTVVARKLATVIPTPEDLKLPRPVREFVNLDVGIVLVVGATGSGKSTTLASLLADICISQDRHVITLEQPIEFILPQGRALVSQREMGTNFSSFSQGLRQALRQDPDVILVGELRDLETMRAAFNAAETGHLVLATVHAYDAISTLGRIVNAFPAEEQEQVRAQLSYILKGIVAQKLLPLAHSRGRAAAYEVLLGVPSVASNLRRIDGLPAIRQAMETGSRQGMQTMDAAIAQLVHQGVVTYEAGEKRSSDPEQFRRTLDRLGGTGASAPAAAPKGL
jgi:twitching motility protein PilT